jgi:predicted dehydrogenase
MQSNTTNYRGRPINCGILGTGNMAEGITRALQFVGNISLTGVASRKSDTAKAFAQKWGIGAYYDDYRQMLLNPGIDIVYIASPHSAHYEQVLAALEHGKHVLCEKPLTLNASQARTCVELAKMKGLFLMEAVWMRFIPAISRVKEMLSQGVIGRVKFVSIDFAFHCPFDADHRLYNLELGGGALLDVGIYPLSLANMLFGLPVSVTGKAHIGSTGVDEFNEMVLTYPDGLLVHVTSSMCFEKPREAFIVGEKGYIRIHEPFFRPETITLRLNDGVDNRLDFSFEGNGYPHEIREVLRCLSEGLLESPIMPWCDTIGVLSIMDECRRLWGVKFPSE